MNMYLTVCWPAEKARGDIIDKRSMVDPKQC
jgi:hypothetical protein